MKISYTKHITALILFGSNGIVASQIQLNGYEIVFYRTLIGSIFLIGVFLLSRQKTAFYHHKKHFLSLIVSGIAMGISWVLLFEAYRQIGVSLSTLAYYCGPVLVMVLSPLVFKERVSAGTIAGFLAVVAGMIFVNGAEIIRGGISLGLVFGILAAVMYAVMVIFNKKAKGIVGLENSMCQLVISCIVVAIFTAIMNRGSFSVAKESILPLLFLGVVNTGIGCYLYFSSLPKLSAQTVSIFGYFEPLAALLFSGFLLSEQLNGIQILGAALILGGAIFGELIKGRRHGKTSCV